MTGAGLFQPELGQMCWSGAAINEYEVSELGIAALHAIGDEIERVMWNITQEEFYSPTGNVGSEFETDTFTMRSYCWCDGSLHDPCPPNFEWRDARINWYKHAGRGTNSSIPLTPDMIAEMLTECLAAIRAKESDA